MMRTEHHATFCSSSFRRKTEFQAVKALFPTVGLFGSEFTILRQLVNYQKNVV